MYNDLVTDIRDLPIKEQQRQRTDALCMLIPVILALVFFAFTLVIFINHQQEYFTMNALQKIFIPDCEKNYREYGQSPITICTDTCPDQYLKKGRLCIESNQLDTNKNVRDLWQIQSFKRVVILNILISLGIGITIMSFIFLLANKYPIFLYFTLILFLIYLILSLYFPQIRPKEISNFIQSLSQISLIVLGVILMLICIIVFIRICFYYEEIKFTAEILNKTWKTIPKLLSSTFCLLLIFQIAFFLFLALCIFQFLSLNMYYGQRFTQIWRFNHFTTALQFINIFEFLWGLSFLKDSYNYCISSLTVKWIWNQQISLCNILSELIFYHFGTIVGGSLLNLLFFIPNLFVEAISCQIYGCCERYAKICRTGPVGCGEIFNLARTDSYTLTALTGLPFCNASRESRTICYENNKFVGGLSPIGTLRLMTHLFCNIFQTFLIFWLILYQEYDFKYWQLIILWIIGDLTMSWTIDLYLNLAEAIQTILLASNYLGSQDETIFSKLK